VHIDPLIALAGLIVGVAVGLTGMGGGALMTPILVLIFGIQPLAAVSSDLVASLIMKPAGSLMHIGHRTVNWPLVAWLSLGSVPGALLGVVFLKLVAGAAVQNVVEVALGSVLLLSVAALGVRWLIDNRRGLTRKAQGVAGPLHVRRFTTTMIGLVVGFIVGITATGSGTLIIISLLILYPRLRGSQLVGTDLTQAIPMVGAAAIAHILFGDFKLGLTLSIVAGALPGVLIGSTVSARGATGLIRGALAVVLFASGLKLLNAPTVLVGVAAAALLLALLIGWLMVRIVVTSRRAPQGAEA
jgi:uncharacterized protein